MSEHDHEHGDRALGALGDRLRLEAASAEGASGEAGTGDGDGDELERELAEQLGDDEGDEPQPGDDDQPPEAEKVSDKEIEQTFERLDKETARHVKRVAELVGEGMFAYLRPCPLCHPAAPGFIWPGPIGDEVKQAVRLTIGDREPEDWQADTFARRCDDCHGLGEVLTGSRVRGKETLPCIPCGGNGWIAIGPERTGRPATTLRAIESPDEPPPAVAAPIDEPPEAAALRAQGYVVIRTGGGE